MARNTLNREEEPVENHAPDHEGGDAAAGLFHEMGQAAQAGWPQTARLIAMLVVAAAAIALLLLLIYR